MTDAPNIDCEETAPPTLQDDVWRYGQLCVKYGSAYAICAYQHDEHDRDDCPAVQEAERAMTEAYGALVWRIICGRGTVR